MNFRMLRWLLPRAAVAMIATIVAAIPIVARASVSVSVTWDDLLQASTEAAVVTPIDAHSAWESGRIFTYSHVRVDRAVAGTLAPGGGAWVRTMGGIVGDTGQRVEGEAQLVLGQPALVFLQPGPNGAFHVTARAQGQFPVIPARDQHPAYVVRSGGLGALVPAQARAPALPAVLAVDALHGRSLDDAVQQVLSAWTRTHPR